MGYDIDDRDYTEEWPFFNDREPQDITCSNCGATELHWIQNDSGRYVLADSEDILHICAIEGKMMRLPKEAKDRDEQCSS